MAEVTGTVKYDGKEIEKGYIEFTPDDPSISGGGGDIINGKYHCKAVAGPCHVKIKASRPTGKETAMGPEMEDYIPKQYNRETTLTADVGSKPEFNFDLKSEAK